MAGINYIFGSLTPFYLDHLHFKVYIKNVHYMSATLITRILNNQIKVKLNNTNLLAVFLVFYATFSNVDLKLLCYDLSLILFFAISLNYIHLQLTNKKSEQKLQKCTYLLNVCICKCWTFLEIFYETEKSDLFTDRVNHAKSTLFYEKVYFIQLQINDKII